MVLQRLFLLLSVLSPAFVTAQSFGPLSNLPATLPFRNPAIYTNSFEQAAPWNFTMISSVDFARENDSTLDHLLAGGQRHWRNVLGPADAGVKLMVEHNTTGALRHGAVELGTYLAARVGETGLKVAGGLQFGFRTWAVRLPRSLRPWDYGDPLLALDRRSAGAFHLGLGGNLSYERKLPRDPQKIIRLTAGFTLPDLLGWGANERFDWLDPVSQTRFTLGAKQQRGPRARADLSAAYSNRGIDFTLRAYVRNDVPFSTVGWNAVARYELERSGGKDRDANLHLDFGQDFSAGNILAGTGLRFKFSDDSRLYLKFRVFCVFYSGDLRRATDLLTMVNGTLSE